MVIFWLLFFAALVLGVLTTLPLALILFVVFYALKKELWLFTAAFFAGVILDLILVRTIGASSLFFVSFLFLVELYGRKFETATTPFVFIASFIGSILYLFFLMLFGQALMLWEALVSALLAVGLFKGAKYLIW